MICVLNKRSIGVNQQPIVHIGMRLGNGRGELLQESILLLHSQDITCH